MISQEKRNENKIIIESISCLCPNCEYKMVDFDYKNIEWIYVPPEVTIPTEKELEDKIKSLSDEYKEKEYQRQRAPEYPDIREQLDAIWKGGDAYEEMLAKVMEVKAKYPKPE